MLEYGFTFHDPLFVRLDEGGDWAMDDYHTFSVKNLKFVTIPGYTFEISYGNIFASAETSAAYREGRSSANPGTHGAHLFERKISWKVEKFNNGPAGIWPQFPNSLIERRTGEAALAVSQAAFDEYLASVRPVSPAQPKATNFDTEVTGVVAKRNGDATDIVINFNEALRTGDYGFGLDIADLWTTVWNEDGMSVTLTVADKDLRANSLDANLIIFRLMDKDELMIIPAGTSPALVLGNLMGGPITETYRLPLEVAPKPSASAFVQKLNGNMNNLTIYVERVWPNGNVDSWEETFNINNNSAGTYIVGPYSVYVDTKGNDQIRACYFVD